jgi:nucleoside 2-deoxyribosyltransferase
MKAYISVSYSKRKFLNKELNAIIETLNNLSIEPFVFVDNYNFDLTQERQMMEQVMIDIENCDFLIAETSDKGIGIGIEVGYAKAKNKPIIYVRQNTAEHSTTVSGISDYKIVYHRTEDLKNKITDAIHSIINH